jgi:hypothetical protein
MNDLDLARQLLSLGIGASILTMREAGRDHKHVDSRR